MEACFDGGANRFSLGVQSFNTAIRQSMGRVSTREELIAQLERLMSYNQAAVIVDLIYGFPRQTMELMLEDIAVAQSLYLDGRTATSSTCTGRRRWARPSKRERCPPERTSHAVGHVRRGVRPGRTRSTGRLSVSHWARTSRERNLYNLYVKGRAHCLAFGPGAGGTIGGYFYLNRSDYRTWQEQVHAGHKPVAMLARPAPHARFSGRCRGHGAELA